MASFPWRVWRHCSSRGITLSSTAVLGVAPVVALAACRAPVPPLSPAAEGVEVGERDAPSGASNLGPVEATHGEGCGIHGTQGTYESAVAVLRNEAAARGGDYVHIVKAVEPHVEGGCYDNRFIVRGILFRTRAASLPIPAAAETCSPPCSGGYTCDHGGCRAVCEPPCGPTETCGQDRTCRPMPAPSPPAGSVH
jgi:hypothetical protein